MFLETFPHAVASAHVVERCYVDVLNMPAENGANPRILVVFVLSDSRVIAAILPCEGTRQSRNDKANQ